MDSGYHCAHAHSDQSFCCSYVFGDTYSRMVEVRRDTVCYGDSHISKNRDQPVHPFIMIEPVTVTVQSVKNKFQRNIMKTEKVLIRTSLAEQVKKQVFFRSVIIFSDAYGRYSYHAGISKVFRITDIFCGYLSMQ